MTAMLRTINIIVVLIVALTALVLVSSATTKLSANSRLEIFSSNEGHSVEN